MSAPNHNAAATLGPVVQEHPIRFVERYGFLVFGGLFILIGLFALGRAVFMLATRPDSDDVITLFMAAAPFLLGGGIPVVIALLRWNCHLAIHQGGVYYRDRKREWIVPWAMIDGVYHKIVRVFRNGVEIATQDNYTVALRDGSSFTVDYRYDNIELFGKELMERVTAMLLPQYLEAFRAGRAVTFGVIGFDGYGIHANGQMLPWQEVEGISWKRGFIASEKAFVHVKRRGALLSWAKLPVEEVKNYQVMMALAAERTYVE
ncbi:MAG: DUF6585 family protein [Polyangiaceae bacterium]